MLAKGSLTYKFISISRDLSATYDTESIQSTSSNMDFFDSLGGLPSKNRKIKVHI